MPKSIFPVPRGTYAGMTEQQVTDARNTAQQQLIGLLSGTRPQSAGYTQGEGGRNVTFAGASEAQLRNMLRELNALLGVGTSRRAIRPYFR
ncbi:hypothetical protein AA101099_1783 [Neoasaia chiangmaiensis NBRC 101099]|uniref:Uncharacterized protein n=1 Tax=Neoasaia chiangmaiensis TaxID=320497 RepID=A0A1U9KRB5_9PROT|nr:gpW family head-tail joining protein [Neoasaia chiangmaiensis]AQS88262.1 hypothetical protein A0U93_10275 [Neoasaia chiangmaiensis]GBR39708.1 hypothetical protein AA101099_1783 [Neoasaia chiangmaiensis NBRC 101099]GEN14705.1 hypothetical protein NCH01_11360 [Neoasaia chiangmaiensis]